MKRTSVVEHNLYFAQARDRRINQRLKPKGLRQINNNYNTSYNHYYNINLKPKVKTIAPIKYWRIMNNKNAEIITENTYKYLQPKN